MPALVLCAPRLRAARRVRVLSDVQVAAAAGDVVTVEGANGSGKSTLLAAAAGVLPAGPASHRPATVGYAPERADVLPRLTVRRWLTGLARSAGLSRDESAKQVDQALSRIGLASAAATPLRDLSRGNAQRALVAQATLGPPGLVVLDEPAGGLDEDGLGRVTGLIRWLAGQSSVVLVARHPSAPLPLPAGPAWQLSDGAVRAGVRPAPVTSPGTLSPASTAVSTGGPASAGGPAGTASQPRAGQPGGPERAGGLERLGHGAAHRARVLVTSQWFAAPALVFLAILAILYAGPAGPPLPAAAFTAAMLAPVMTWVTVLAQLADGRMAGRAFAAHVGGRGRAQLAATLATAPFALVAVIVAVALAASRQPAGQITALVVLEAIVLHLAAAVFGAGVGTLLAPPVITQPGWRVLTGVALYLALILVRVSPLRPLLIVAENAGSGPTVVAATLLLAGIGAVLAALTVCLADRLP